MADLKYLLDVIENKRWPASALPEPIPVSGGMDDLESVLNTPFDPTQFKMPVKKEAVTNIIDTPLVEGKKERIQMMTDDSGKKVLSPKTDLGEMLRGNYNEQLNKQDADAESIQEQLLEQKQRSESSDETVARSLKARAALAGSPFPKLERTDIGIAQRLADLDKRRAAAESAEPEGEDMLSKLIYAFGPGLLGLGMGGTAGYKAAGDTHKESVLMQKENRDRAAKKKERTAETAYKEMMSLGKLAEGAAQLDKQNFDSRVGELKFKEEALDKLTDDALNRFGKKSEVYKQLLTLSNDVKKQNAEMFKSGVGEISDVEQRQIQIESDEKRSKINAGRQQKQEAKSDARYEMQLRKEIDALPEIKGIKESIPRVRAVLDSDKSAAGDITRIYSFMKLQDPTSAILPTEYATAENSAGVADWVRNLYNKAKDGQKLNEQQRQMFAEQAISIYNQRKQSADAAYGKYKDVIAKQGVDPGVILTPIPKIEMPVSAEDKAVLDLVNKSPNDKSPKMERLRNVLRQKGLLK